MKRKPIFDSETVSYIAYLVFVVLVFGIATCANAATPDCALLLQKNRIVPAEYLTPSAQALCRLTDLPCPKCPATFCPTCKLSWYAWFAVELPREYTDDHRIVYAENGGFIRSLWLPRAQRETFRRVEVFAPSGAISGAFVSTGWVALLRVNPPPCNGNPVGTLRPMANVITVYAPTAKAETALFNPKNKLFEGIPPGEAPCR